MTQKAITVVIDEFSDAVAALAEHAPSHKIDALHRATADLLEAMGTAAQVQATQFAMLLRDRVTALQEDVTALEKRTDRRVDDVDVEDERRQVNE